VANGQYGRQTFGFEHLSNRCCGVLSVAYLGAARFWVSPRGVVRIGSSIFLPTVLMTVAIWNFPEALPLEVVAMRRCLRSLIPVFWLAVVRAVFSIGPLGLRWPYPFYLPADKKCISCSLSLVWAGPILAGAFVSVCPNVHRSRHGRSIAVNSDVSFGIEGVSGP